jgi:hypothetical protein
LLGWSVDFDTSRYSCCFIKLSVMPKDLMIFW